LLTADHPMGDLDKMVQPNALHQDQQGFHAPAPQPGLSDR
jgi:hypothetical protein